jgi:hypothetical protein
VGGGREREQNRRRPAEEGRDGLGEQRAHPAEIAVYIARAVELRESFSRECAAEEEGEQEQDNAADLAAEG